jgi:ankyrin repeat protein
LIPWRKDKTVSRTKLLRPVFLCVSACLLLALVLPAPARTAEIHNLALAGDLEKIKALLDTDPELLDNPGDMGTPLIYALLGKQQAVAEYLIAKGANVNAVQEQTGFTPLHGAVYAQSGTLTGQLLDRGAEINARSLQGVSALDLAIIFNKPEVAAVLIARGSALDENDGQGRLPLTQAADLGRTEIVKSLLEAGADPEARDSMGQTALLAAAARGRSGVLDLLLQRGADVAAKDKRTGRNSLHLACITGHLDVTERILAGGADVTAKDAKNKAALFYAAKYGHKHVAELLRTHGAKPESGLAANFGPSPHLKRKMESGQFVAWYLNNRGWALKTRDHLVIFDAEEFGVKRPADPMLANGFLSAGELSGQNLLALYTCYHGDPGELAAVHELADRMSSAAYVHLSEDRFRDGERCHYLGPAEEHKIGAAIVRTIEAATGNPAHAYLVHTGGLSIFYMGFHPDDPAGFVEEIEDLAANRNTQLDVAFLPIPESSDAGEAFFTVLEKLQPRTVCLLDPNRREELFPAAAERMRKWGFTGAVFYAEHPGDHLVHLGQ